MALCVLVGPFFCPLRWNAAGRLMLRDKTILSSTQVARITQPRRQPKSPQSAGCVCLVFCPNDHWHRRCCLSFPSCLLVCLQQLEPSPSPLLRCNQGMTEGKEKKKEKPWRSTEFAHFIPGRVLGCCASPAVHPPPTLQPTFTHNLRAVFAAKKVSFRRSRYYETLHSNAGVF